MRRQGLYYTQAAVVLLAITSNTDWLDNTLFCAANRANYGSVLSDKPVASATNPEPTTIAEGGLPPQPVQVIENSAAPEAEKKGGSKNTQKAKAELKKKVAGAYKGVFFENDFSYLDNPLYTDHYMGERLKRLSPGCTDVEIGGEQRVRYHSEENMRGLGLTGRDDTFWLTRTRAYANVKFSEDIRVYGEVLNADSGGQEFPARTIEVNRMEMQNLFGELRLLESLRARVGRQELIYGNQRLVSPLDWANTRRTFEGAKLLQSSGDWKIDGFWVRPMETTDPDRLFFSRLDSPDDQVQFYGLYATNPKATASGLDYYYLGLEDGHVGFSYHTIGTRVAGDYDGLLYETELAYQFGSEANGDGHAAGMVVAGLGHKVNVLGHKTTVWGWYDYASGDSDPQAGGFHHLFL